MSFQQFLSNWRYRRHLATEFERFQNIQPPKNPSRRYMDRLVRKLCHLKTAWSARKELAMIGAPAVPSLLAGLHRPEAKQKLPIMGYFIPFDSMIEMLVPHAPDEVEQVLIPLAVSPSEYERKCVARNLASLGRAASIPVLSRLLNDEDGYVKSAVVNGIGRAVSEERASPEFRAAAYDLLLAHCPEEWSSATNGTARVMFQLDRERASADLLNPAAFSIDSPNLREFLKGLDREEVPVPEHLIRPLFEQAQDLALASGKHRYQRIASLSLKVLSRTLGEGSRPLLERSLACQIDSVALAAAEMLARLAGVQNAKGSVDDRCNQIGFDALTEPQRHLYCVSDFDRASGLIDYLGNIGTYIPETVDALHAIGMDDAANALAEAIRTIGPIARDRDRELRLTAFEGRYEHIEAALEPLEQTYKPTIRQLPIKIHLYAIQHAKHFRTPDAEPMNTI